MILHDIRIGPNVFKYCKKRQLITQLKKSLQYLQSGESHIVGLKIRQPKKDEVYEFRINKQFRGYGRIINGIFYIKGIHNHQN